MSKYSKKVCPDNLEKNLEYIKEKLLTIIKIKFTIFFKILPCASAHREAHLTTDKIQLYMKMFNLS